MAAFNTTTPQILLRRLGTPDCPAIIDVRLDEDFAAKPHLIPTARRCKHDAIASLVGWLDKREAVIICQKGLKLSHGAAALLRCEGVRTTVLEGGMSAWQELKMPLVPVAAVAPDWAGIGSVWVTRHRPKIDRIACAWLIRRFVDPGARFLFVPSTEVSEVAQRFGATAFDTPDARWTHRDQFCTFDAMIEGFGLTTDPLYKMAQIIRAADTNRHELAPEAAGLLAISVGLSRAHKSDLAQLEAGMTLYDALYRWARDGQSETHDWPGKHL